jgi:protein TonB
MAAGTPAYALFPKLYSESGYVKALEPRVKAPKPVRLPVSKPAHAETTPLPLPKLRTYLLRISESHGFERGSLARQVLLDDPTSAEALLLQRPKGESESELIARLKELVASHPDSAPAWLALAKALPRGESHDADVESLKAAEKAYSLEPDNYSVTSFYIREKARSHQSHPVLPLALRNKLRAPWNPELWDEYALVLAADGQCAPAVQAEARALDILATTSSDNYVYRKRRTAYETKCTSHGFQPDLNLARTFTPETMTRPRFLSGPSAPEYTVEARANGVEGILITRCLLTDAGVLDYCAFLKPLPGMDLSVAKWLQQIRYSPALFHGKPVDVSYVFNFHLKLKR